MGARDTFSFKLIGFKELTELLDRLPTVSMRRTVIRNALKKAGKPIAEAARANVPQVSGYLRDSIKVTTSLKASQRKRRFDRSTVTVYIGSSAPHAHLVEFGTVERVLEKPRKVLLNKKWVEIRSTGFVSPNPFLRKAWDSMKTTALKIFVAEMKNEIYKSARRLAKRAAAGKLTKRQIEGLKK